jgi:O-antigen/teichoic acid export membrane protein
MGIQANSELLRGILGAMHVFMIMNLIFPWLDYCNGLIMLFNQTKFMVLSQSCNLAATLIVLIVLIFLAPGLNGTIGAWAQSLGCAAELIVVTLALRGLSRHQLRAPNTLSA